MPTKWRTEMREYRGNTVVLAFAPFNSTWRERARAAHGRWRSPFDIEAWQFETSSTTARTMLEVVKDLLRTCYPDQDDEDTKMNSSVPLERNERRYPTLQTPTMTSLSNGAAKPPSTVEMTSVQIAEVVSKIVTKRVDMQAEELKAAVHRSLDIAERTVTETANALNKRLDQVLQPTIVYIQKDTEQVKTLEETTHFQFPELLDLVTMLKPERRNVWLTGPAGSGKTHAARQVGKALNREFFFNGSIDTEYKLSGFIDAQGRIISTAFRKAWEEGGVYLFDECDGSMASALLAFNAALANGHASFPDKVIMRHPSTVILAAANTYGWGGTANYVGRAKLDGAFLDRFSYLPWEYDERLERAIAMAAGNGATSVPVWIDTVQLTRKLVFEKQAQVLVSPRRSIDGADLLAGGMKRKSVVRSQFAGLMNHSAWSMISRHLDAFAAGN